MTFLLPPGIKGLIYFKMERSYFEKVHWNDIKSKRDIQTTLVFNISKTYQKKDTKTNAIFCVSKLHQNMRSFPSKLHQKIHQNNVDFSSIEIRSKIVHRNDVDISLIEVTPNKVHLNGVDFWLIEITSMKVRQNNVEFLPIEITSKKYIEMTWKFINIFFGCINVISTSNCGRVSQTKGIGREKWLI